MDSNRIICEINRKENATPAELKVTAKLYMNDGILIELSPNETNIETLNFKGCTFKDLATAIKIGEK